MLKSSSVIRIIRARPRLLRLGRRQLRKRVFFAALCIPLAFVSMKVVHARATSATNRGEATRRLQGVLADATALLGITQPVVLSIVPDNPHIVSVSPPGMTGDAFVVSIAEPFLDMLSEDELQAAIAHELGHVWVFTHHPYLQTELLANQIAMRVVSRDSLTRVYEKVWKRDGHKGDLQAFLGTR